MEFYEICLVGVALAMDAVAVTISNCTIFNNLTKKDEYLMPITFGVFQGVMTLLGYMLSSFIEDYIKFTAILPPVIFSILALKIFIDKIIERRREKKGKQPKCPKKFSLATLIVQGFATSIDALAIGITLINVKVNVALSVTTIALITFLLVAVATIIGKKTGEVFGKYATFFGGEILLILAIKSFIALI